MVRACIFSLSPGTCGGMPAGRSTSQLVTFCRVTEKRHLFPWRSERWPAGRWTPSPDRGSRFVSVPARLFILLDGTVPLAGRPSSKPATPLAALSRQDIREPAAEAPDRSGRRHRERGRACRRPLRRPQHVSRTQSGGFSRAHDPIQCTFPHVPMCIRGHPEDVTSPVTRRRARGTDSPPLA